VFGYRREAFCLTPVFGPRLANWFAGLVDVAGIPTQGYNTLRTQNYKQDKPMEPSDNAKSDPIQAGGIPKRKDDYRLEQLDDELLLYHPSDTKILYLNQSASLVWGLCDGEHSVVEIIRLLSEAYPEAVESIPGDVRATLEQFLENGCIEWLGD